MDVDGVAGLGHRTDVVDELGRRRGRSSVQSVAVGITASSCGFSAAVLCDVRDGDGVLVLAGRRRRRRGRGRGCSKQPHARAEWPWRGSGAEEGRGGEVAATARRSWPRSSAYVARSATSQCLEPRHDAGAMGTSTASGSRCGSAVDARVGARRGRRRGLAKLLLGDGVAGASKLDAANAAWRGRWWRGRGRRGLLVRGRGDGVQLQRRGWRGSGRARRRGDAGARGEVMATVVGVRPGLGCWMEGAEEEGGAVGEEQKAASALYRAREG